MTDLVRQIATALGAAYRVERELGGGGMSSVFLAEEVALGRKVVVKVLPPEMAASVNQERFRREIQLAARLQHPHIVPLLSASEGGELLWYTMPYIEGESLRAKLAREGELPVGETVRLLREVTDALAYAHEQGVVHRDIKPDNVMVSRGHALVTDFGVAKAVSDSGGGDSLTSIGIALGTPLYMAPEQAAADPHVDHRADLYALGIVAYEMLAGRPPFTATSAQGLLMAHLTQTPEPLSRHRPSVPASLASLVARCLEKRPADRWQTAAEMLPHFGAEPTPSGTQPVSVFARESGARDAAAVRRAHPARVTALFVVAAAVVLALTLGIQRALGLPAWMTPVAAVLLTIGLPITLLTARRERARIASPGMTGSGGFRDRLLTWRGAIRGGALAIGGLFAVVAALTGLGAAGIGPLATLLSAGVLEARDKLVLADFTNRTSDSTLAEAITEALRVDLTQSPVLRLTDGNEVAATLRLMGRDLALPLDLEHARTLGERIGAKAVLIGEVTSLGAGYVISARLVSVADTTTLLAERATAADAASLIAAVEQLSRALRERIGESLTTVREAASLPQVMTSSLDALRAYSEGARLSNSGRQRDAVTYYEQAVALDSNFGMAWRAIGVLHNNRGDIARAIPPLKRAYALRGRMPPLEALLIEGQYHATVDFDIARSIAALERVLSSWPDQQGATNNLGYAYSTVGRLDDANRMYRRAVAIRPTGVSITNLIQSLANAGELAEADSVIREWRPTEPALQRSKVYFRTRLAIEADDFALATRLIDSAAAEQPNVRWRHSDLLLRQGRLKEAATFLDLGQPAMMRGIILGQREAAVREFAQLEAGVPWDSLPPNDPRAHGGIAVQWGWLGEPARAETLLARATRDISPEVLTRNGNVSFAQGLIALERGDARTALAKLREAEYVERCFVCATFDIGRAFEKLDLPDSAIAAYTRFVDAKDTDNENREWFAAAALRRLGELHESRGDNAKAVTYYDRFVKRWERADAELQPLVGDVRKRADGLRRQVERR